MAEQNSHDLAEFAPRAGRGTSRAKLLMPPVAATNFLLFRWLARPGAGFIGLCDPAGVETVRTMLKLSKPRRNQTSGPALGRMDDKELEARTEQALVVVTLSTATLIASIALLVSSLQ